MTSRQLYEWLKRNWRQDRAQMKYLNSCSVRGGCLVWPNGNANDMTLWRTK